MVQFLKAKPTSFVNKPVGIVGTDTGGQRAGQVLARVAQDIATTAFARATADQEKFGKDYARNMKIDIRDTEGNLQFKDIDSTLSDIARASAEPLVRQRYGEALRVDINNEILNIRRNSRSANEFKTNVETRMGEYITSVKKYGGGDYEGIITQDIAKISSQHFNDMSTEEFKESLKIAATNKQSIITQSNNDYVTSIADSVRANSNIQGDIGGIKNVQDELNVSKFIVDKLLQDNDSNYTENNQDAKVHGATYRKLKASTTIGLMRGLISGKEGKFIRAVRRNLLNNEPTVDANGKELLSDYEKDVLELIKKQNQDKYALDELTESLTIVSGDESNARAIAGFEERQENKFERDVGQKSESLLYKQNVRENINDQGTQIANDIIANEELSENDLAKINKLSKDIFAQKEFKTITIDGETVGFKLTEKEILVNTANMTHKISQRLVRNSGLFGTSAAKENLANFIRNDNDAGLTEPQKKVAEQIKKVITSAEGDTDFYLKSYGSVLTQDAIAESKQEQNIEARKNIDITLYEASTGIGKHTSKKASELDVGLGVDDAYFGQGAFQRGLEAEEGTAEYQKANAVDQAMTNGFFPASFLRVVNNAVNGNASAMGVNTALNYFNKYTKIRKSGGVVDRLVDVLDKKTYNLLSAAASMQVYIGQPAFGIELRQGQTGIDSGQLMTKLIQTQQSMDTNSEIYKANFASVAGDNKVDNSFELLFAVYKFDLQEAKELQPAMDIFLTLGVDKNTIDNHFKMVQDAIYADGEGTIIDAFGGGRVLTRSKFSLIKTIPDDIMRSQARHYIQNILSNAKVPRKETELPSKFILNYTPNAVDFERQIRTKKGRELLAKRREELKTGTPVFLQPQPYGPDMTRVRYNAFYKDNTGGMQPVKDNDGIPITFDLDELMETLNPDFDPDL
jgi:hypothetical protein